MWKRRRKGMGTMQKKFNLLMKFRRLSNPNRPTRWWQESSTIIIVSSQRKKERRLRKKRPSRNVSAAQRRNTCLLSAQSSITHHGFRKQRLRLLLIELIVTEQAL